jgi:2-polyprenyl-3-methyl-5-hydroxy-6-metoxy-1,4-benzoquinol methylase
MGCIICKDSRQKRIYKSLTQCENCKLVYFEKKEDIDVNDLYGEGYFQGEEYFDYKSDKAILQKNFARYLKEILKYKKGGNLFEIGCAYGFFLDLAKKYFSVEGIDIAKNPTAHAKNELGLNVATGYYTEYAPSKKYDAFCLWDTIEHLESPEKFIGKISSELNPGGYLFLTTGAIESLLAKARGRKWRMIHPPTHLFYFSKKTITKLLKQHGLEVVSITHPGVYRSFKQIVYSLFFLNKKKPSKKNENLLNRFDLPIYINTFDIMMVVAKKI